MKKGKTEILAPAGSYESMKAAVNAGADAVYMGGQRFGARAYADNPDNDMLLSAIDYVHLHGRKIYLTVNTLLKEKEMEKELYSFLLPFYEAGADGLIVQDLGVCRAVRRWFPDMPLHASTQMTIAGKEGALMAERLGAVRIVTARELSLEEIREIRAATDLEIEAFVHGALCYCYSGQCLYSSLIGGRSGNRGRCAQPCRLPYDVYDGTGRRNSPQGRYVMNLKDLCALELLPDIIEAGVCSLKIEGRMKSPRYTAGVVSVYRKYVDLYDREGKAGYRVDPGDREYLLKLFDRGGFTDGYFREQGRTPMIAPGEKPAFREVDGALLAALDHQYIERERKEKIKGSLTIQTNFPAILSLSLGNVSVSVTGETALPARKQPLTEALLRKQMNKFGETPFELEELALTLDGDAFLPMGAVNALRRKGAEALEQAVLKQYRRQAPVRETEPEEEPAAGSAAGAEQSRARNAVPGIYVLAEREEQLEAAFHSEAVERIYVSLEEIPWEHIPAWAEKWKASGREFFIALPKIWRSRIRRELFSHERFWHRDDVDGFLIRTVDEWYLAQALGESYRYVADHSLYSWNHEARKALREQNLTSDTAPVELNERELRARGCEGSEMVAYGYLPMMVSAQCFRRNTGTCDRQPGILTLRDRKKKAFSVKNFCRFCYNTVYNSEPLWLADEMAALRECGFSAVRLQFTAEGRAETEKVIAAYAEARNGKDPDYQPAVRTKGHFRRGTE